MKEEKNGRILEMSAWVRLLRQLANPGPEPPAAAAGLPAVAPRPSGTAELIVVDC